jgi:hypothetical protein
MIKSGGTRLIVHASKVQHPELIRVGQQARQFCADTFDCSVIALRLVDTYNNMVEHQVEVLM